MKAAVEGVVVLNLTLGAHGKSGHRGLGAIVGNAAGDGEARSAVGAIQEWVAIASVRGIKQLTKAVGAGGSVGGDAGTDTAKNFAGNDAEAGFAFWRHIARADGVDARQGRGLRGKSCEEGLQVSRCAFELDGHASGVVADEAGQIFLVGQAINERAKADALDDPAYPDAYSLAQGSVDLGHCSGEVDERSAQQSFPFPTAVKDSPCPT